MMCHPTAVVAQVGVGLSGFSPGHSVYYTAAVFRLDENYAKKKKTIQKTQKLRIYFGLLFDVLLPILLSD